MGSRAGYRTRQNSEVSQILRKQWACSIEEGVKASWAVLSNNSKKLDGMQAIRDDLDNGRAFAALVTTIYNPPFDSIEKDTDCDIDDNGLFIVDISQFDHWTIYLDPLTNDVEVLIAEMNLKGFTWKVSKDVRDSLGEGIF